MTFWYPDLSHFDDVSIEDNTVAVAAKATHGTSFVDSAWTKFRDQARQKNAFFFSYHWLNHGNARAQADYYLNQIGPQYPVMIDAEDTINNTGFDGYNTVEDSLEFADEIRKGGGACNLAYVPPWYWLGPMNRPDMTPFNAAGLHVVSSYYTSYSDNGPGWNPFGGISPYVWQYTNALAYGNGTCDFNACRDTVDNFIRVVGSKTVSQPTPPYVPGTPSEDQRSADWWNYFFRDKLAFGGIPEADAFLPKLLKETHDAAVIAANKFAAVGLSTQDKADIVAGVAAAIVNDVAEAVFERFKEQYNK